VASLALAGGVAAGVGSFLAWAELSAGPVSEEATGISGWEGKATLIAGIVMAVAGARVFTGGFEAISRLRPSASIGGLIAIGVCLYTALTAEDQLVDVAAADLSRSVVEEALESGLITLSLSIGLYVVAAGGVLGVAAATATIGLGAPEPASAGSGLTGWAMPSATSTAPSTGWAQPQVPPAPGAGPWVTPPRPDEGSGPPP
jgi:hypothetical protein